MSILPTNFREQWLLFLFPFKAYVLIAPIYFSVWDLATSERSFRGSREYAEGVIGLGYLGCFLMFIIVALFFCIFRDVDVFWTVALFALWSFLFPIFIAESKGSLGIVIPIFLFGMKLARQQMPVRSCQRDEQPFACPACQTTISSREQKCSLCGWTYLA